MGQGVAGGVLQCSRPHCSLQVSGPRRREWTRLERRVQQHFYFHTDGIIVGQTGGLGLSRAGTRGTPAESENLHALASMGLATRWYMRGEV